MGMTGPGRVLFALSFAALGALIIAWPDFAQVWQAIPKWLPWHDALATVYGAALLAGGIALFVPRMARRSSLALAYIRKEKAPTIVRASGRQRVEYRFTPPRYRMAPSFPIKEAMHRSSPPRWTIS